MVPQTVYPESTHSSLSGPLNKLLKTKLREHALVLRNLALSLRGAGLSEGDIIATLRSKKEVLLGEVYSVMTATLGVPPQPKDKFVWDYYDKDGKTGRWEGTAKQFYDVCRTRSYSQASCLLSFRLVLHEQAIPRLRLVLFN